MKLKRFLALAVSAIMVLAMVPAISVSAAENVSATAAFSWNFTGNAQNGALPTAVSWGDYRACFMSFALPESVTSMAAEDIKVTATLNADMTFNNGRVSGQAPTVAIIAVDGNTVASANMSGGATTTAALKEAVANGTYLASFDTLNNDVSPELDLTSVVKAGNTSVGLYLTCRAEDGRESGGIVNFNSPVLVINAAASTTATVVYTDGAETLWTETVSGLAAGGSYAPTMPGSGVIVKENVAYDVVSVEGIGTLSATASENVATVTLAKKFGIVKNFIENGDFETGDLTGWGANEASDAWFDVIDGNNGTGNKVLKSTANGWVSHEVCAIGGERSFQKVVTGIEPGKVYYYTADVYTGSNVGLWMNYSFLTSEARMIYGNTANLYVTEGAQTNCTTDACAVGTQLSNNYKQQWHTFSGLVTADDVAKAFEFDVYYLHDSPNSLIDNVAFYETDIVTSATTIKYVDAQGTELKAAATVNGFVGDVIDLTDETIVPATVTYNGNLYSKADSNATAHTVATAADVVEVVYVTDAVTALDNTTTATVIDGNAPVLPAAIKATTGTGTETTVNVDWNVPAELNVGVNTIYGTVEGSGLQAEATVTVLEEAFAISDITTVNGQDAGKAEQKMFPVAISDEFSMEFTANYASFGDLWITIKAADAGFFGPEQLPLGVNASGAFRPVNGNGAGGRTTADADQAYLTAGVDYRFFITTDASTDKYTVTIFNEATGEKVVTVENFGYRTNATAIEAITSLTNNGAGSVTLTNIKVASDTVSALKQEYTVVTVVNGVTESTETVKALSADEITAEERAGYMLTKNIEGNTITFTYVSTIDVTITYTANGETIKTETKAYDPLVSTGAEFEAVTYYANGVNAIYTAEAATYSESQSVELTAVANNGTHAVGDVFVNSDGTQYDIKSANLVPNGDFSLGLTGWYNAAGGEAGTDKFTVNGDGTITALTNEGTAGAGSLYRAWAIEPGKTYLFTWTSDVAQEYQKVAVRGDIADTSDTGKTVVGTATGGTNNVVFTAGEADTYIQINFRWLASSNVIGNFGLYEIAPAEVQITEEIAYVEAIADVTAFGNDAPALPTTLSVTGTLGTTVNGTVVWDASTFPVGTTPVTGTVTAQFGTAEPVTAPVSTNVTVIDEFTLDDSLSVNNQPGNVVYFPVAITGEFTMEFDYTINQIKDVSLQMGYNGTLFSAAALGISPNGNVLKVTGGNKAGTGEGIELVNPVAAGDVFHMVLTMDASDDTYSLVVELADGTVVTTGEKGFRIAQDAINTMTLLTNGGGAEGDIAISNIKVTADSNVEFCTVTVDGVEKQVIKGRSYKQALTGAALVDEEGNVYAPVNGVVTVPVNADMVLTTVELGLEMIDGAQVRIGATELEEGAKLDAMADSGLRFLATADYNDTIISMEGVEFGIKVTAEGSDKVVYVPATKFQDDDNTVFSAAITNLAESNYNRKYTAVAYAKVGGVEITTAPVTRSIYQVSAGIMMNGNAGEDAPYTVDGVVKNILNAYVNQTGIRLSYTADGITVEEGKYTGDVFFTVTSVSDGDDGYNVTITPDTSWGTPAEIAEWWMDYVRFNNNNSVAKTYISGAEFVDGALTFNFDTTADDGGFAGEEDPLV